jgi:hypothetical protein
MVAKALFAIGAVLIIHAAFSCLHYRSLLKELGEEDASSASHKLPPNDVWVQVIVGYLMVLLSELLRGGRSLRLINSVDQSRPLAAPVYRTRDFDIYATRNKVL